MDDVTEKIRPAAERYRDQAKRLRDRAAATKAADVRGHLLDIAEQYERVADSMDQTRFGGGN